MPERDEIEGEVLTDAEEAEEEILTEMNAAPADITYHFRVSRVLGAAKLGAKEPFLFDGDGMMIAGLHSKLLSEYGSGTYRVRITKQGRFWRRFDVSVETAVRSPEPPKSDLSGLDTLAKVLSESAARTDVILQQLLRERGNQSPIAAAPALDPFALFDKVSTMVEKLLPRGTGAAEMIEVFKSGLEIAGSIGSDGREKGMVDLVSDLLKSPLLGAAVARLGASQQSSPDPVQSPAQLGETSEAAGLGNILIQNLNIALAAAKRNSFPDLYAEFLLDNLPEEISLQIVSQPDALQQLIAINPAVAQYRPWFEAALASMRLQMQDGIEGPNLLRTDAARAPDVSHGNPGGSRRDGANPASDAGDRPGVQEKS